MKKQPTPPTVTELSEQVSELNAVFPLESEPIRFRVQTTDNPKPDAARYTIRTIADIMAVVNAENVERFLADFAAMLKFSMATIDLMQLISDEAAVGAFKAKMNEFVWIDDHQ